MHSGTVLPSPFAFEPVRATNPSLRSQIAGADHLAPGVHIALDQRTKLLRTAADRYKAQDCEALLDVRACQGFRDFAIEHDDDVLRRPSRREDAHPLIPLGLGI